MTAVTITVGSDVIRTPRLAQVEGIFDVPISKRTQLTWNVDLPLDEQTWNVGLIVGPSGSGKSTVARHLWPEQHAATHEWHPDKSILDSFPAGMPVKEIVTLLCSVGFSSPPSWMRPYRVLSTGEQFRVSMARTLAETPAQGLAVVDEFTSVVDRTVAQIGSYAVARTVRARNQQFVALSCHEDVVDWLQPDWIYNPGTNIFSWRLLQRRPEIQLEVFRVHHQAWGLFAKHHYLDANLNHSATCFIAMWRGQPVSFNAWLSQPHGMIPNLKRATREVVLPDYQGVGIGHMMNTTIASMWKALGYRAMLTAGHPAVIRACSQSTLWHLNRQPSRTTGGGMMARGTAMAQKIANKRLTAGFEYVGPPMDPLQASCLLG